MAYGKIDPKIVAAYSQLRADFDAARGMFGKAIDTLRQEFTAAQLHYNSEIALLWEEIDEIRDRVGLPVKNSEEEGGLPTP